MLKNTYENNENKKVNSREIKILKENFPQYFNKDGDFKIDEFKKMLEDDEVNFDKEGYRLDFLGKSYARFESALETETVITPDTKHNNEEINKDSENMYIVGDNIDALKHLLKSYTGKIKCIYIDPPYNTGSDGFVYPDNFKFDKEILSKKMGVSEDEAERILSLQGKSTHSAWLTFIYPRLLLARDLLADDGVIFISIDDNEQANLRIICDDIFGEENFEGHIHWRRRSNQPNDPSKMIGIVAEHIIVYTRNSISLKKYGVGKVGLTGKFSNPDNDLRGPWNSKPWKVGSDQSGSEYRIDLPNGKTVFGSWMGDENTFQNLLNDNRIFFPEKGEGLPRKKIYKSEREMEGQSANNWWHHSRFGSNQSGTSRLKSLFNNINIFSKPKPNELIKGILQVATLDTEFYILDFFSGSATTADAVMQLNAEDGGNRKYILVQIPEEIGKDKPAYEAGYRTIDEIGRERIKRAAVKIKEETNADIDYGFKLYRLNEPDVQTIDKLIEFNPDELSFTKDDYVSNFSFDGENGKDTILTTWLNEDGYGLLVNSEPIKIGNYTADIYKDSLYIIEPGLKSDDIMELIKLLEKNQLNINRVVAYGYSLNFNIANELRNNLKNLKNNQSVSLIERY